MGMKKKLNCKGKEKVRQKMNWMKRLVCDLIYGGSHDIAPHEAMLLRQVRERLQPDDQAAMDDQMTHVERVQRHNHKRMVTIWLDAPEDRMRLSRKAPDHCLAKLKVSARDKHVTVAVMTHAGIISSIEFSSTPEACTPANFTVQEIALNQPDPGISGSIDSEEHGQ
ncbi:MAG: hypothetical protein GX811_02405 [Lentisphaerae bacterium]|nr:hypothetical protein [Lentisphaerota bacterium]